MKAKSTFLSDEDADRNFLRELENTLLSHGWKKDLSQMRCFLNIATCEIIEVEPGGAETSGHFLHRLKAS
jgi:hypothetical protein